MSSIISPELAEKVATKLGGRACTDAGLLGQVCGRTADVDIAVSKCVRKVETHAIVAELPSHLRAVLGEDVLRKVQPLIAAALMETARAVLLGLPLR